MVVFVKKQLYLRRSGCIGAKVVVFGKIYCIQAMWLHSSNVDLFVQKWLYSGSSCCIRAYWLYSGKMVLFGQGGCLWAKCL